MEIAEALEKIKSLDGGEALVGAITAHTKTLRDEAADYRTKLTAASGKLEKVAEKLGVSKDGDLEAAIEAAKKTPPAGGNDALVAEIARLKQDFEAERKAREAATSKANSAKAESALKSALAEHKAVRPDDLVRYHLPDAKYKDDGSPYFVDSNGAERSVSEHVQGWLKDRPEFVQSAQRPGPGGNGANGGSNQDLSKLSATDRIALGLKTST
jgi:hypothetical protein